MPITCPICNSEYVVVVCRVLVNYTIEGELCGEQDWSRENTFDDSAKPQYAECKHCKAVLGVVMVGKMLAALTQKSAPGTVTHPLTEHHRSVSAGDLEPEALCQNCGGVGCHACLTEVRDAELEEDPQATALEDIVAELEQARDGELFVETTGTEAYEHALALLRRVVPGEADRLLDVLEKALPGPATLTFDLRTQYTYSHRDFGPIYGPKLRDALRQLPPATAGEKETG